MGDELSCDVLRRVREDNYTCRSKRRKEIYFKYRHLEGAEVQFSQSYKNEDVSRAARAISDRTVKSKQKFFNILKNAFVQNSDYILLFMKTDGGLHSLIGHLTSNNSEEQLLAAECCCNLSLGDSKSCFILSKSLAPYLVTILQGLNHNLKNVALQTVINLSGAGKNSCKILYSQGILKVLGNTMETEKLQENTAKAFIMFTKHGSENMVEEDIHFLLHLVLPYFEKSDQVQWLVHLLSSLPYNVLPILTEYGILLKSMLALHSKTSITSENIRSATALVRILGNLTSEPEDRTAALIFENWNVIEHIVGLCSKSNYDFLSRELLWFLGNVKRLLPTASAERVVELLFDGFSTSLQIKVP